MINNTCIKVRLLGPHVFVLTLWPRQHNRQAYAVYCRYSLLCPCVVFSGEGHVLMTQNRCNLVFFATATTIMNKRNKVLRLKLSDVVMTSRVIIARICCSIGFGKLLACKRANWHNIVSTSVNERRKKNSPFTEHCDFNEIKRVKISANNYESHR